MYYTKYPIHVAIAHATPNNKALQRWNLNDPRFQHRAVMSIFPHVEAENPRSEMGVLFRVEHPMGEAPYFLIQSNTKPSCTERGIVVKEFATPTHEKGEAVHFKIAANAISRDRAGKATPVEDVAEWIDNKLSGALENIHVLTESREIHKGRNLTVQVDTIEGVACVENPETLQKLQIEGVGRAKSYGCGLLTVAKV